MKNKPLFWAAVGFIIAGGLATASHWPGGTVGMVLVFFGMIIAPGYLLSNVIFDEPSDPWGIYPLSLVLGVSCFGLVGMIMFFLRAPVGAAYPSMAAVGVVCAVFARKKARHFEKGRFKEAGALGWIFAAVVFLTVFISLLLGSFRGWAVEWDYYTYITMIRRIVARGVADNFPLAYSNESHDPIHSYNVWALMWAAISTAIRVDPISLYIKSGVLVIPAAILAFYSLAKTLFDRAVGMAATVCYALYHFIAMGFILLGRCSFYNADPAWLIFFPTVISLGWRYSENGGRGRLAACMLTLAGTMMVHPLWGVLSGMALALGALVRVVSDGSEARPVSRWASRIGWVVLLIPVVWGLWHVTFETEVEGGKKPELWWDFIFFLGMPLVLWTPRLIESARNLTEKSRRAVVLVLSGAIATIPFVLLRFIETRGARMEEFETLKPYNWFITESLYVLHPFHATYTAPDITLFPWTLLMLLALPWLIVRYRRGNVASLFAVLAILLIPVLAFHPYLSWIFDRLLHMAYLRRALRFSSLFAAVAVGMGAWAIARHAGKWAGVALVSLGLAAAVASGAFPVNPDYFRGAMAKSIFIMLHRPAQGLFWQSDDNAHRIRGVRWDTEEFAVLLKHVPLRETVLSDPFSSYRITAYRDIYVLSRLKYSIAARDQLRREEDASALTTAGYDSSRVCNLLRRYRSRWILLNLDPGYRMRGYFMWTPQTVNMVLNSGKYFEPVDQRPPWVLFRATSACAPWPPEIEAGDKK